MPNGFHAPTFGSNRHCTIAAFYNTIQMIEEHDRVVLRSDVPTEGLEAGDVGTIVHIYEGRAAYEVEFVSLEGRTLAVVTLEAARVRPVHPREITRARELTAA